MGEYRSIQIWPDTKCDHCGRLLAESKSGRAVGHTSGVFHEECWEDRKRTERQAAPPKEPKE